uniref:hypothetical protein n=1 Tax=Candidatus Symbiothrix dinenymphae TaxID=467085 RepID=UPI000AF8EBC6
PQWSVGDGSIGIIQAATGPYNVATGTYTSIVRVKGLKEATTLYGVKVKQGGADTLITAPLTVRTPRIRLFEGTDYSTLLAPSVTLDRMGKAAPLILHGGISGLPDDSEYNYLKWKFAPDNGSSASVDGSVEFSNGKKSGDWQPQTELWEFNTPKAGLTTIIVTNCNALG